jgi:hypothetical protein
MVDRKRIPPLGLILSLVASMGLSLAGLLLVRWLAPASWLRANNEVAGNYLQTLGTIYAVLLAFVVFVVWQQHNEVRGAVETEANELADLDRIMQAFPEAIRAQLRARASAYCQAVAGEEWQALAHSQPSKGAEGAHEHMWQALAAFTPQTPREEVLYAQALARLDDLSNARSHRLHCSRLRLPPTLWVLLLTNGGLVTASMWLFGLDSFWAQALMTAALTGSIAFVLYLIADLDNPFWGAWRVTAEPFHQALARKCGVQPRDTCNERSNIEH